MTAKVKTCIDCKCRIENAHNARKRCENCVEKFRVENDAVRWRERYLNKIVGAFTQIEIKPCMVCKRPTVGKCTKRESEKRRFCSVQCKESFYTVNEKERYRWINNPFTFKLSDGAVARRQGTKYIPIVAPCFFCGSQKVLSEVAKRNYLSGKNIFCDEQCASEWRSIHYASPNHRPFEESRQRTKASKALRAEEVRKRQEEREVARLIRPINAKTPGYYTCVVCKKTEWVEQHSQKQYCSDRCRRKSIKAKRARRNRMHKIRSKALSQTICLDELMKKHRNRCKHCKTLCVKPEGYNHPNEATMDHIMPLSKGGLHLWNNVQLLCRQCNTAKRDKVLPGTQMMLRFDE